MMFSLTSSSSLMMRGSFLCRLNVTNKTTMTAKQKHIFILSENETPFFLDSNHKMELVLIRSKRSSENDLPSKSIMQARIAIRAPMLRPMGRTKASTLHDCTIPSRLQPHTRMVKVFVLLNGGSPSSVTTMGRRYVSCFCRRKESCLARTLIELSGER